MNYWIGIYVLLRYLFKIEFIFLEIVLLVLEVVSFFLFDVKLVDSSCE